MSTEMLNTSVQAEVNSKTVSVLLIDDEFEIFKRLKEVFDTQDKFSVVGQASSFRIGTAMIQTYNPEIVIFNAEMSSISPEEAPSIVAQIMQLSPNARVVTVVPSNNPNQIFRVLKAGSAGCLTLNDIIGNLLNLFDDVLDSKVVIPPSVATLFVGTLQKFYGPLPGDLPAEAIVKSLTNREKELLLLMMKGYSYEQIGEICDITVSTVKTHFNAIFCKMGVKNRVQAIGIALRQDIQLLIEPSLIPNIKVRETLTK